MKNKKLIILFIVLTVIILALSLLLHKKNDELSRQQIKVINAGYNPQDKCSGPKEIFYEDDNYVYSFPCIQSSSTYVKFPNGNKMLVIKALEEEKVTINELESAGLIINKDKK